MSIQKSYSDERLWWYLRVREWGEGGRLGCFNQYNSGWLTINFFSIHLKPNFYCWECQHNSKSWCFIFFLFWKIWYSNSWVHEKAWCYLQLQSVIWQAHRFCKQVFSLSCLWPTQNNQTLVPSNMLIPFANAMVSSHLFYCNSLFGVSRNPLFNVF